MKRINHMLFASALLCIVGLVTGCKQQKTSRPAHLRAISMIQYASVKLTIRGKNKNKKLHKTMPLGYSQSTEYQQLSPGNYDITLSVRGKELLKKNYVLGKNGYYTLLAMGLLPRQWEINPETSMYHLKYIFAGAELESTNSYLPQWTMMRDNYDGNKNNAYIRFVNANPHTPAVSIKKDGTPFRNGLAYPTQSTMLKMKAGSHHLQLLYGAVTMEDKKIQTEPGYIYTAIIGNKENAKGTLSIRMLTNPSRTLLHAK